MAEGIPDPNPGYFRTTSNIDETKEVLRNRKSLPGREVVTPGKPGTKRAADSEAFLQASLNDAAPGTYFDASDALANKHKLYFDIWSETVGVGVKFKAFLTTFADKFTTALDSQTLIGHAEPLRKLKTIERTVDIGLDIPAASLFQAKTNLKDIGMLVKMLHPAVDENEVSGVKQRSVRVGGDPLFRIRFQNLLAHGQAGQARYAAAANNGLKGYIDNLSYDFDIPMGFYSGGAGYIYPKLIKLSFTFYPFHEETPGWVIDIGSAGEIGYNFTHGSTPYAFAQGPGKAAAARLGNSWHGRNTNTKMINTTNEARIKGALGNK